MANVPSLGSATAEGALHELAIFLINKQNDATANPNNVEMINEFSRDNRDGTVNITIAMQSSSALAADGKQTVEITPVFT